MSDPEISSSPSSARRFTLRRAIRSLLLIALGVAGYAAFQLVPGWIQAVSGRETVLLRRQAGVFFVDALLIAYPLTLIVALFGRSAASRSESACPIWEAEVRASGWAEAPFAVEAAFALLLDIACTRPFRGRRRRLAVAHEPESRSVGNCVFVSSNW